MTRMNLKEIAKTAYKGARILSVVAMPLTTVLQCASMTAEQKEYSDFRDDLNKYMEKANRASSVMDVPTENIVELPNGYMTTRRSHAILKHCAIIASRKEENKDKSIDDLMCSIAEEFDTNGNQIFEKLEAQNAVEDYGA